MTQKHESRGLIAMELPREREALSRVFTRGGGNIDANLDVWEWTDGPFKAYLDFGRFGGPFKHFVEPLKQTLVPFLRGHSSSHVTNLFHAFVHFLSVVGPIASGSISAQHVGSYAARLGRHEVGRLGTLNVLLQRWVALNLPGVDADCANYLIDRRKPGNRKGHAVVTRDPVNGPFTDEEYRALNAAVNEAYGRGDLPLWALLLNRLLLACGGRISQFASLKACDFDDSNFVLSLPQAKNRAEHTRESFIQFDIAPQTGALMSKYIDELRGLGYGPEAALFPQQVVMRRGPVESLRSTSDLFYGHCLPASLASAFKHALACAVPPSARLDFAPLPLSTKRFRYTYGTRLAEEGASRVVIANRLGHVDLQNVEVYVSASPKVVENIDAAMGAQLAPIAAAFKGRLVEDESQTTHKGAPGSRILDFRVSTEPVGSCAGRGSNCRFSKPVACYSCFKFEPWLDAPHTQVLERLLSERTQHPSSNRVAAVNDESIKAVQEVIHLCAEALSQRNVPKQEDLG